MIGERGATAAYRLQCVWHGQRQLDVAYCRRDGGPRADERDMSAFRRSLAVAAAVAVAGTVSGPAVAAKPKPARATKGVCATKSGSLRPSPVRVCRKAVKAPRALPR